MKIRPTHLPVVIAVLHAVAVLAFVFPRWTVDDAYITFRYADNLARAGELTWNVGEDPIEGYTGAALPVLLAGAIRAGADPRVASPAIGVLSLAACALFVFLILRALGGSRALAGVAAAAVLSAPMMFTHATSGLETLLFGASILGSAWLLVRCMEVSARPRRESALALSLLLGAVIRPEGAVAAAAFGAAVLAARIASRDRRAARGWLVRYGMLCVLPGFAFFVWRWSYYGHMLPNTFYVKSNYTGPQDAESRADFAMFALKYLALPLAGALLAGWSAPRAAPSASAPRLRIAAAACGAFMAILLAKYFRTSLAMNYSHRFYAPLYPLFLIGFAWLARRGFAKVRPPSARMARLARGAALACVAAQFILHLALLPGDIWYADWYRRLLGELHQPIAEAILRDTPEDSWIICYKDAGIVPYLTRRKAVDFGRLNDERLAMGDLTIGEKTDYFFERDPVALLVTSFNFHKLEHDEAMDAIAADKRFGNYVLMDRRRLADMTGSPRYFEFYYLRADLAEAARGRGAR